MQNERCAKCYCLISAWLYWRKNGYVYCSEECAEKDED